MRWRARLAILCIGLAACGPYPAVHTPTPPQPSPPPEEPSDAPDFLDRIDDQNAWETLAYRPDYQAVARTEVVKVVIDLQDEWRPYFLQSSRYELHYSFVHDHLDEFADHGRFNARQYRAEDREYVLASLVHYIDGDHWTFEMVPGDLLDAPRVKRAFELLRDRVFFGDRLHYRPLSPLHESRAAALGDDFLVIDGRLLASDATYQPAVVGVSYGVLRIAEAPINLANLRPNEILLTDEVPEEIPPLSGLITASLQAPLAHVAVLSRSRGTPDMALRGAMENEAIRALEGAIVRLEVGPQDYTLERAPRSEAEAYWANRRPSTTYQPGFETETTELLHVCDLEAGDIVRAGAKASQLGTVCAIQGVETPGGFAVPFAHYANHLRRSGAASFYQQRRTEGRFSENATYRAQQLAALRARIEEADVPENLIQRIRRQIRARSAEHAQNHGRAPRWIFRSSTNAEDLVGFSGAGLYRSVVLDANPSVDAVTDAIRQVWASVWLERAYEERDWFRIDHEAVQMAVLCQPFVEGVVANGVAITRNPYDEARPAVYVNTQVRGTNVTAGASDALPEEILIYTWTPTYEFHVLGRSNLTDGQPILRTDELNALGDLLTLLHSQLEPTYGRGANAVDVEYLLSEHNGERRFVIVQARPILIRYTEGQTWRRP